MAYLLLSQFYRLNPQEIHYSLCNFDIAITLSAFLNVADLEINQYWGKMKLFFPYEKGKHSFYFVVF